MIKKRKNILSLALIIAMIGSFVGCGAKESAEEPAETVDTQLSEEVASEELAWLNVSTEPMTLPLVNEGYDKHLTIWYREAGGTTDPENRYDYKFIEDAMNVDLDVVSMPKATQAEIISTGFISGDLPDIIIGSKFNTSQLVQYGVVEEQLVDLAPYLNETYMPNLTALIEANPGVKETITDSEGRVWSVPLVSTTETAAGLSRFYLNYDWIEELGLEVPRTTEEFLNVMRAMKADKPDSYPVGGSFKTASPIPYFLNAFGYIGDNDWYTDFGNKINLRDGETVIPAADREAYGAFLEFMKTLYEEELIHPDFFTMDESSTTALVTEGKVGFFTQAVSLYCTPEQVTEWWGAYPLTSEYNSEGKYPYAMNKMTPGGGIVTTACEDPALAAAFLDWFYNSENLLNYQELPLADKYPDLLYGTRGSVINEIGDAEIDDLNYDEYQTKYADAWSYMVDEVLLWHDQIGLKVNDDTGYNYVRPEETDIKATTNYTAEQRDEVPTSDAWFYATKDTLTDNLTKDVYPMYVYFDGDTVERINELKLVVDEFAQIEQAKFITGERSLDELDQYFGEIEKLGALEYVKYYADYYESVK